MLSRTTKTILTKRLTTTPLLPAAAALTDGIHRLTISSYHRTAAALLTNNGAAQKNSNNESGGSSSSSSPSRLSSSVLSSFIASDKWSKMYAELGQYVSQHGNAQVPTKYSKNPDLGYWVDHQRIAYRRNDLSEEQIALLESLGFVWDVYDQMWESKFAEYKTFVKTYQTTIIPRGKKCPNPALSVWVSNQRHQYKSFRSKGEEESTLTQERIDRLNDVGFIWDLHEYVWNERFEELIRYKNEHGDCLVPKDYTTSTKYQLGRWVEYQRQHYRLYHLKKPSSMTPERIQRLNDIDFVWFPYDYLWNKQYEELVDFEQKNGHVLVTRKTCSDIALVRWMEKQRAQYRKWKDGKRSSMTEERRLKLEELGFTA